VVERRWYDGRVDREDPSAQMLAGRRAGTKQGRFESLDALPLPQNFIPSGFSNPLISVARNPAQDS
jgi:hypothetical protein